VLPGFELYTLLQTVLYTFYTTSSHMHASTPRGIQQHTAIQQVYSYAVSTTLYTLPLRSASDRPHVPTVSNTVLNNVRSHCIIASDFDRFFLCVFVGVSRVKDAITERSWETRRLQRRTQKSSSPENTFARAWRCF
jgi:hypothetical protein